MMVTQRAQGEEVAVWARAGKCRNPETEDEARAKGWLMKVVRARAEDDERVMSASAIVGHGQC